MLALTRIAACVVVVICVPAIYIEPAVTLFTLSDAPPPPICELM